MKAKREFVVNQRPSVLEYKVSGVAKEMLLKIPRTIFCGIGPF